MSGIPLEYVITNAIIGNAVLSAIFLYLWRVDRREQAMGYWAGAYVASTLRLAYRLFSLEGGSGTIYAEALFDAVMVVLLGMGALVFIGITLRSAWRFGLLAIAGMVAIAELAVAGILPLSLPNLIGGMVYFLAGLALLERGRKNRGIGYGVLGALFALHGGYLFAFSHLAYNPGQPDSYIFGPIISLAIGVSLLVISQRKQYVEAEKLSAALLAESESRHAAENTSAQNEQRYRAILDSTRSMVGLLDPRGLLLDINQAALVQIAARREDLVGKPFWLTPWWTHDPEQRERLRQAIRRVAAGGHDRFEVSHPDTQGGFRYFDFFLTPIRDDTGQVVFLVPEAHDITDRLYVEKTLHAAEQRFRAISDVSMLGVFVTDESGNTTSFSRRASEITGISETDALAGRMLEFVLPEDRAEHLSQWRMVVEERKPFAGERRFVRNDGIVSWCRLHAAPIIDGSRLLGVVGTVEDVNGRKRAELALRDSEERFSRFFALSPEPFAVARFPTGEYIQVNDAWEQTFGYGQSEVAGKNALDLGMWEEPDQRVKLYGELVRRGQARSGEIRMLGKGGRPIHAQISAQVVNIGKDQYILWSTHDLSERDRMTQALRVSEERISHVFYLLPDLVTINSLEEGRFYDMNHHWESMLGYSREEALGKTVDELGIWPDREARRSLVRDIRGNGLVRNRQTELCRKDGQIIFCETSGSIFDWQGQRLLLLVTRDVTAQRKADLARATAENNLRASEEMFSTIFHELPVAIAVTTSLEGRFIDVNPTWLEQFGYRRGEVIGKTGRELDIWVDYDQRELLFQSIGATRSVFGREAALRTGDGRVLLTEFSGRLFKIGDEEVFIAATPDITERKQIEKALRESEDKFSSIFRHSPVALAVSDIATGAYLDVNEAWEALFGYRRENILGRSGLDFGLWVSAEQRNDMTEEVLVRSRIDRREAQLRCRDQTVLICEISGHAFDLSEQRVLLWAAHDVTERRNVQRIIEELNQQLEARVQERTASLETTNTDLGEALKTLKRAQEELIRTEKLAALGSLVAGIAHELHTPIGNSVTVASTLFEKMREFESIIVTGKLKRSSVNAFTSDTRTGCEMLLRNLSMANELIGNFKQVAVDQASSQRRTFDLKLSIEEIISTLLPMIRKTPFKLELDLADNLTMDSYSGSIGQVITNLVTNALSHAFDCREEGVIRIRTSRINPDQIGIEFSDDGVGIPKKNLKHVFDPFFTTRLGQGGSGLGLHIVYNLVTRVLGGNINVFSAPGKGTRFELSLPLNAPQAQDAERQIWT